MVIKVRIATIKDLKFFYKLRNEAITRSNFFESKYIKNSTHIKWYKKNFKKKSLIFLVGLYKNNKIGIIRFNKRKKNVFISIIIAKKFRNIGFGSIFLKKSEKFLKEKLKLIALVKKKNKSSKHFFKKNNYKIIKRASPYSIFYKKINF
jgi:hypothetical protein